MIYQFIREQVLETVLKAVEANLIRLSAGNISTRAEDGLVAITPSGVKYRGMLAEDISIIDLNGELIDGPPPSSETPMHTAIYRNVPHVNSICHAHSPYAITFAMLGDDIPAVNLELMFCGAPIPVAPWACPGTPTAGEIAVAIYKQRPELKVLLLRQHGLVAIGENLENAFDMALNAEVGCQTYYQARLLGQPLSLTHEQLAEIREAYNL